MIAWAEASTVAVGIAVISVIGTLIGGFITYLLKQQDVRAEAVLAAASRHQEVAVTGIAQILSATDANTKAIAQLNDTVTAHLTFHVEHAKVY